MKQASTSMSGKPQDDIKRTTLLTIPHCTALHDCDDFPRPTRLVVDGLFTLTRLTMGGIYDTLCLTISDKVSSALMKRSRIRKPQDGSPFVYILRKPGHEVLRIQFDPEQTSLETMRLLDDVLALYTCFENPRGLKDAYALVGAHSGEVLAVLSGSDPHSITGQTMTTGNDQTNSNRHPLTQSIGANVVKERVNLFTSRGEEQASPAPAARVPHNAIASSSSFKAISLSKISSKPPQPTGVVPLDTVQSKHRISGEIPEIYTSRCTQERPSPVSSTIPASTITPQEAPTPRIERSDSMDSSASTLVMSTLEETLRATSLDDDVPPAGSGSTAPSLLDKTAVKKSVHRLVHLLSTGRVRVRRALPDPITRSFDTVRSTVLRHMKAVGSAALGMLGDHGWGETVVGAQEAWCRIRTSVEEFLADEDGDEGGKTMDLRAEMARRSRQQSTTSEDGDDVFFDSTPSRVPGGEDDVAVIYFDSTGISHPAILEAISQ